MPTPVPIRTSDAQREAYVQNILAAWHSADARQLETGRSWYRAAHQLALVIGDGNVRRGAGIIAALSVQKSWDENVRLATRAADTGAADGHVHDALVKANAILYGASPEALLPMRRKTGHFYRCILNPADPEPVCVDRHAHDVAVGVGYGNADRGLGAHGRYEMLADCYREAARRLQELPQAVQAVVWTVQIDRITESGEVL